MQRTQRAGKQTGGNDNQKRPRPTEKLRQIQAHPALINQRANHGGSQNPRYRAGRHLPRRALFEYGKQEKKTLSKPSRATARNAIPTKAHP